MNAKFLEVRDEMTRIDVMAIKPSEERPGSIEHRYFWRAGFNMTGDSVILVRLNDFKAGYNPHGWETCRTMTEAHLYVKEHWGELKTGDVVDVQYIMGEATTPKGPESWEFE